MPLLPSGPDGVNGLSSRGAPAVNASHAVDCMFDRRRALFLPPAQPFNHAMRARNGFSAGEGGIRTLEAVLAPTRFPGVPVRPLQHLSAAREKRSGTKRGNLARVKRRARQTAARYATGTIPLLLRPLRESAELL